MNLTSGNIISVYLAGGLAQSDALKRDILMEVFTGVIDYEHEFNERHGINAGVDFLYDNRFRESNASDRWQRFMEDTHCFYKFDVKMQVGTYVEAQRKRKFLYATSVEVSY